MTRREADRGFQSESRAMLTVANSFTVLGIASQLAADEA